MPVVEELVVVNKVAVLPPVDKETLAKMAVKVTSSAIRSGFMLAAAAEAHGIVVEMLGQQVPVKVAMVRIGKD
jgi:hypothetical protein